MFRRRPGPLRATLVVMASAVFLCLLFLPAKDEGNLAFVLDWRPEIEPLLVIAGIALLAVAGRHMPALARWLLAAALAVAALLQAVDAAVLSFFDRALDLYFDLPHVPRLIALFYDSAGAWRGTAAIIAAVIGMAALVWLIARALLAIERALRVPRHAAACLGTIALLTATAAVSAVAPGESWLGARATAVVGTQAARLYRAYSVIHGYDKRYAGMLGTPQPPAGPLPRLKRNDVYVIFFESYGAVALDDPRYAATVLPALGEFAATVGQAGYHLASDRIVSPTFGGGSWLAHGTIDSGLKLDALLTRVITDSDRRTLPRYLEAAGYRSVAVIPGLKSAEPEQAFWGFDRTYDAGALGYGGPPFGWFAIPDQYTLRRFDQTEAAPGHGPLFAQIVLVSSHTPFAPVPPYVADWRPADLYEGVTKAQWDRIYAEPDWSHLGPAYAESVVYDLKTLGAWLAQREGDALVVILGDHQPPGFISGEKQPWTVPIHVLSRDADLVKPFLALGYAEGPMPPEAGGLKGMESFLGDFLTAFAAAPAEVATHPETREHLPD